MFPSEPNQVEALFQTSVPRRRNVVGLQAMLTACLLLVLILSLFGTQLGIPEIVSVGLPPIVLSFVLAAGWLAGRRRKRCRDSLAQAWELLQLEKPSEAAAVLQKLMKHPIASDADRGQAFLLLGGVAERLGHFDAAARAYELMLINQSGEILQLQEAQVNLAEAKLRNHELTDAVTIIGRLAQVPMPPTIRAAFELVRLFQQVFMGHHADVIDDAEERRSLFRRYLSTRAGYGYGLLAAAMHQTGRADRASSLWLDATTLVSPDRLIREYPLLEPISRAYAPAGNPL